MQDPTISPLLDNLAFQASGRGRFGLTEQVAGDRFPRGTRVIGDHGTVRLVVTTGAAGTAQTVCYLTDDPSNPVNYLAIRLDTSNRPFVQFTDQLGVIKAKTIPSFAVIAAGIRTEIELEWDAYTAIVTGRHSRFSVNGVEVDDSEWSPPPSIPWVNFQPTYLFLGAGLLGDVDFLGTVDSCQITNVADSRGGVVPPRPTRNSSALAGQSVLSAGAEIVYEGAVATGGDSGLTADATVTPP